MKENPEKFLSVVFLNSPNDLFKKLKKFLILILRVKIDIAITLSSQTLG